MYCFIRVENTLDILRPSRRRGFKHYELEITFTLEFTPTCFNMFLHVFNQFMKMQRFF